MTGVVAVFVLSNTYVKARRAFTKEQTELTCGRLVCERVFVNLNVEKASTMERLDLNWPHLV